MKKIICLLSLVFCLSMKAQPGKEIRPETPAITQFLRYDEMPVSEYTGVPNISIPIYTIKEDGLELPLQLTYHAGGIKVNQQASWVGLGWDLKLGSIVQIINDEDDFGSTAVSWITAQRLLPNYPATQTGVGCVTNFPMRYYPLGVDGPGWTATYPTYTPQSEHVFKVATDFYIPVNGDFRQRWERLLNDEGPFNYDSEPDIFKADILGVTLHFMINWKTNSFVVLNKKGYTIDKNGDQWTIANPYGEKFHFAYKTETITSGSSAGGLGGTNFQKKSMVAWLLNKITTRNGKVIDIEYTVTDAVNMPESYSLAQKTPYYDSVGTSLNSVDSEVSATNGKVMPGYYKQTATAKEPYFFIKKITFPKGWINFDASSRVDIASSKKLDKVSVYSNGGSLVASKTFTYGQFLGTTKRLKLNSVRSEDGGIYTFTYNTNALPDYQSISQDAWGYYNGHSNITLIPNPSRYYLPYWTDKTSNGNNLSSNLTYTKTGILTEIIYPSGGKVCFDYESNTFDNYVNRVPDYTESALSSNSGLTKGHGLRIKTITHKDRDDTTVKEISYQYEGGKAILPKTFFRRLSERAFTSTYFHVFSGHVEEATVSGHTIFNPLSSFSSVGYDKVIKRVISPNSNDQSRIETTYHNNPDITFLKCSSQDAISPIPAYKNTAYPGNGSIASCKYFDSNNVLAKEEKYTYSNSISSIYYGVRLSSYRSYFTYKASTLSQKAQSLVAYYPIFDIESLLTKIEEKDYSGNEPIIKTQEYSYDSSNRLVTKKEGTSNTVWGSNLLHTYTYPGTGTTVEQQMIKYNRVSEILTETTKRENIGSNLSYLKNTFTWDSNLSKIRLSGIEQRRGANDGLIDKVTYEEFDVANNPVQIRRMDEVPITYIWGYNRQFIIAEIVNATYTTVKNKLTESVLTALESSSQPSVDNLNVLNNLRNSLPEAQITTYTHKPLVGIISMIDARGVKTTFDYDVSGRLATTQDNNGHILSKNIYHIGEGAETVSAAQNYATITSVVKTGTTTAQVNFYIPGFGVNNAGTTVWVKVYCINKGTTSTGHAGYSNGARAISGLVSGYNYLVTVGLANAPYESTPWNYTHK